MATIESQAVQEALKRELHAIRDRVRTLNDELADLRRREEALVVLVDTPTHVRLVRGDSLRAAVLEYLRREDARQEGVHYQRITQALLDDGYVIAGADKANNVRASIGHGTKAAALFRSIGKADGRYTWR